MGGLVGWGSITSMNLCLPSLQGHLLLRRRRQNLRIITNVIHSAIRLHLSHIDNHYVSACREGNEITAGPLENLWEAPTHTHAPPHTRRHTHTRTHIKGTITFTVVGPSFLLMRSDFSVSEDKIWQLKLYRQLGANSRNKHAHPHVSYNKNAAG